MPTVDIFIIPIGEYRLLYAPLVPLLALLNQAAVSQIHQTFQSTPNSVSSPLLTSLLEQLTTPTPTLLPRSGPLHHPLFLGIIPTRNCHMACHYCDFADSPDTTTMPLTTARAAVNAYLRLLTKNDHQQGEIHFFGGEPFAAADVIHFVVGYATTQASRWGLSLRFEVTTNGLYSARECRWIADHFQGVVLSLDGPPDIQNRHRPGRHGRFLADPIIRNAHILSQSHTGLVLRACVTRDTAPRLPEIAHWFSQEFCPESVCFESLTPNPQATAAGLHPPDPWEFAIAFRAATQILAAHGIETVLSTADLRRNRIHFCPVGQDALIVSPDTGVHACYLLPHRWQQAGLELRLGHLDTTNETWQLDPTALNHIRTLNVLSNPHCTNCLCRYHCAGGCHVNHPATSPTAQWDDLCRQTRLVTITTLLDRLGYTDLATTWLANRSISETAVCQPSDRLSDIPL